MKHSTCSICTSEMGSPCYESEHSLTSLCKIYPQPTVVRSCNACGHLQTQAIDDLAGFYDDDYDILTRSEEEDQVYEVREGGPLYRTEHQINVMLEKVSLRQKARLLDFGCAKGSVVRMLIQQRADIDPYLFDISDRYVDFWKTFTKLENCATYEIPSAWSGSFDLVTSFFSLEHIADPRAVLANIHHLLKSDGVLYGIVPNVLTNSADLIVIDHVNHFTKSSLRRALSIEGFDVIDIDEHAHRGAYIFMAKKSEIRRELVPDQTMDRDRDLLEVQKLATFWKGAAAGIRSQEASLTATDPSAIYGAGFYGSFIYSALKHPERIECFIDQNQFLQGSSLADKPIIAPTKMPNHVHNVYVGLNPAYARSIIDSVIELQGHDINYIYM